MKLEQIAPHIHVARPQWHDPIRNAVDRAYRWVLRRTVCRVRGHDWHWRNIGYVSEHDAMPPPHGCHRCWLVGRSDGPVPWTR